jgi:hypothetical protein
MSNNKSEQSETLLKRITSAVNAANAAEQSLATAQAELVSRSKEIGSLLLEAKKLHPAVKDFEAFLKCVEGLKLSRAYDCMRIAGGRTTDEELKKDARERQRKSRASKRKLPRPAPTPKKPEPVSVTDPLVTESAPASAEKRKAINTDLDLTAEENAAKASARNLAEFTVACRLYLPRMKEADQQKALLLVTEMTSSKPEREAA